MTTSKQYCSFCGAELPEKSRFCIQCGAPVENLTKTHIPETINPSKDIQDQIEVPSLPKQPEKQPTPSFTLPTSSEPQIASPKSSNSRPVWLIIILVILAICLCLGCILSIGIGAFFINVRSETTPASVAVITQEVSNLPETLSPETLSPETLLPETALPVPTDMAIEPATTLFPGREVFTQGIHFNLSEEVSQDIFGEIVPAAMGNDIPEWEIGPEYTRIDFFGYQSTGETFHKPQLIIYPADQYAQMNLGAAENIAKLKLTLSSLETPSSDETLPFLPLWNAGQVFHSNFARLDFQNGSGIRYLTQYAQGIYPINNYSLFYTFQGLTSDERFYIAAIFPVSTPALPDPETMELDQQFYDTYLQYIEETIFLLETQPLDTFTPSLIDLDLLIESLRIER